MKLLPHKRNMITKLRCNNIKLPIDTGRWSNTHREERICHLCNVGLGTEFHLLFECTSADVQRLKPGIHNASFASKSPFKFLEFKFVDRVYHTRNLNGLGWNRNASYFFSTWMELDGD